MGTASVLMLVPLEELACLLESAECEIDLPLGGSVRDATEESFALVDVPFVVAVLVLSAKVSLEVLLEDRRFVVLVGVDSAGAGEMLRLLGLCKLPNNREVRRGDVGANTRLISSIAKD